MIHFILKQDDTLFLKMIKYFLISACLFIQGCDDREEATSKKPDSNNQVSKNLESVDLIKEKEKEQRKVEGLRMFVNKERSDEEFLSYLEYSSIPDEKKKQVLIMLIAQMFSDNGDLLSQGDTPFIHKEIKRLFPVISMEATNENGDISGGRFVALTIPEKRTK